MTVSASVRASLLSIGALAIPLLAFADTAPAANDEFLSTIGYYVSGLGYLVASILVILAAREYGKSMLGSAFTYISFGTLTFFIITVFQKLGAGFFGISDDSMDIWWHLMFYIAFILYFAGLKVLVGLGSSEGAGTKPGGATLWGIIALIVLGSFFFIPHMLDPYVVAYNASELSLFGLHHFLAFAGAGLVAAYLLSAKKQLGQIGKAIADPMLIAVVALSLQHFWELLTESWAVISLSSDMIEDVEKIFLTVSALGMCWVGIKLKSLAKPKLA